MHRRQYYRLVCVCVCRSQSVLVGAAFVIRLTSAGGGGGMLFPLQEGSCIVKSEKPICSKTMSKKRTDPKEGFVPRSILSRGNARGLFIGRQTG